MQARIDILLGRDILRHYSFEIDTRTGRMNFSTDPLEPCGVHLPLGDMMGVPTTWLDLAGSQRQVFVDTSAKLSYLGAASVAGLDSVDKEEDFYPGMGEFETPVYQVPFEIAGKIVTLRSGVVPPILETTLKAAGCGGILGAELFDHFRAVFNLRTGYMSLEPYQE